MRIFLLAIIISLSPAISFSQPIITFQPFITGLSAPVDIAEEYTGRFFIVEKGGRIRIWNGTSVFPNAFLDVSALVSKGQEQGLLSMAFHPDYATNGYFYIYYTNTSGAITVVRYSRATADAANPASAAVLFTIPKRFSNHNGGKLIFGTDGYLYFGTGDGGGGGDPDNNAQNNASLLGKMLRIDVNNPNPPYYNIPPTNPFATSTTLKKEVIANGLRNPWRWTFDKQTGDMWIADVGQNKWEEVNVVSAGNILNRNYGWRCYEGTHVYNSSCTAQPNNVVPVFDYPHNDTSGGYSISGGYVYRGTEYPFLNGYYLFTDYVTGFGWLTNTNSTTGWVTTRQNWIQDIAGFHEKPDGTLYAVQMSGTIHKVVASNVLSVQLINFNLQETAGKIELKWTIEKESKGDVYTIESRDDLTKPFAEIYKTEAISDKAINNYTTSFKSPVKQTYYRLKVTDKNNTIRYSDIVSFKGTKTNKIKAVIVSNVLKLTLPGTTTQVQLYDAVGRLQYTKKITSNTNQTDIQLNNVPKGVLTIKAFVDGEWQVARVIY